MTQPKVVSYDILTDDEKDEIVVDFLRAQERDHFCHSLNLERYDGMLASLPEGAFKTRIQQLRAETLDRIGEVEAIIKKTRPQLPPAARVTAARQRIEAKEAAARGLPGA